MALASIFEALGTIGRTTGTVTALSLAVNQPVSGVSTASTTIFESTGDKFNFSYQFAIVTGTPNGSFFVDVSNDPRVRDPNYASSAVWTPLPAVVFTSGLNNGNANCTVVVQNGARYSRCRWVSLDASAGTGWAMAYGVSL